MRIKLNHNGHFALGMVTGFLLALVLSIGFFSVSPAAAVENPCSSDSYTPCAPTTSAPTECSTEFPNARDCALPAERLPAERLPDTGVDPVGMIILFTLGATATAAGLGILVFATLTIRRKK